MNGLNCTVEIHHKTEMYNYLVRQITYVRQHTRDVILIGKQHPAKPFEGQFTLMSVQHPFYRVATVEEECNVVEIVGTHSPSIVCTHRGDKLQMPCENLNDWLLLQLSASIDAYCESKNIPVYSE